VSYDNVKINPLYKALQAVYPEYKWTPYNRFQFGHTAEKRASKSQAILHDMIKRLLPDTQTLYNYTLPAEDKKVERERGLRVYEFDVSCKD
jgi:hypothetical protein